MSEDTGYVPVARLVCRTSIYNLKDFFYYFDLQRRAACTSEYMFEFRGRWIALQRGQLVTTYVKIGEWLGGKSKHWVSDFLHRLERLGLIRLELVRSDGSAGTKPGTPMGTLITFLMYDPPGLGSPSVSSAGNGVGNAIGNMKEEVSEQEAAAPIASDQKQPPLPPPRSGASSARPQWVDEVVVTLNDVTGRHRRWPDNQLEELASLEAAGIPPARIRMQVEELARRQAGKGQTPRSLRYYVKAIREDWAPEAHPPQQERIEQLTKGVTKELPYERPKQHKEPNREFVLAEIEKAMSRIERAGSDD